MAIAEQELVETRMREAFWQKAGVVLANQGRYQKHPSQPRKIGLEVEYPVLVQGTYRGASLDQTQRLLEAVNNRVLEEGPEDAKEDWLSPELGASQIELHTDPHPLTHQGVSNTLNQLSCREGYFVQRYAKEFGLEIIRSGSNPFIPLSGIARTPKPKYLIVPDYYNQHRTLEDTRMGFIEQVDVKDLAIVGLLNATQTNIEARNAPDAVDLANRGLMFSPIMTALTGNSCFLEGKNTGYSDIRIAAWSQALDTRTMDDTLKGKQTRVGMPDRYFDSLEDYFAQVQEHPFILDVPDQALGVGIGMYWKDTRIKVLDDPKKNQHHLVVELRALSTQPTMIEDMATVLMYLGLLTHSQYVQEPLQPLELIRQNKDQAMRHGLNAIFEREMEGRVTRWRTRDLALREIRKASSGLDLLGLEKHAWLLDIIEHRVTGNTLEPHFKFNRWQTIPAGIPSDKMSGMVASAQDYGLSREEAILFALNKLQNQTYYPPYYG